MINPCILGNRPAATGGQEPSASKVTTASDAVLNINVSTLTIFNVHMQARIFGGDYSIYQTVNKSNFHKVLCGSAWTASTRGSTSSNCTVITSVVRGSDGGKKKKKVKYYCHLYMGQVTSAQRLT